ncbi:TetR family transcriptional regulator [Rhodococcoides trifolii]|uniref:TetR family transcriptional regulator n=1 Tax=Rhodococcoides trifolii TaxID=908250 RepID=A0A917FSM6_9NOCA|nr:TetR/AcrR family transcriptional regulator [Rhodococcus trifolii]GGF98606.1 TetR family transcriptional regulator [Rhodococcus trifolii]
MARADATENRTRIVRAARDLLGSSEEFKLNAVAKAAGVGQGTLYRHFPTREALLSEVYRKDVDDLISAAPTLLAAHEPVEALRLWFDGVAEYAEVKRDVFAAVEDAVWQDLSAHSLGPIGDAISRFLEAGKADGSLRSDVDPRDVILLIGYLTRVRPDEWESRSRRLLGVVLDGLRSRP